MYIEIKKMETAEETRGKAFVHWRSWHEAYAGIVSGKYLAGLTLSKCEEWAFSWPDNILVAKDGDLVVGFVGYGSGEEDGDGEIFALYVWGRYYGKGVGRLLMDAALERLKGCSRVSLWVLKKNTRAIRFYEKLGFRPDGEEKYLEALDASEIRMILSPVGEL